jgi:hypothetical protein
MRAGASGRWIAAAALGWAGAAAGQSPDAGRIAELERKVEALSREVEARRFDALPRVPGQGVHGLSPGVSKVYGIEQGVSVGGYGEALYQNFEDDAKTDEWDFLRAVLYTGYKYNDRFVLNTEIEFEHAADDQEGEVSVEFAYLDYLHAPWLNVRGGLVLVPMGLLNELHEPTTFFSARRPDVESRIIPSTWRENGAGAFGEASGFSYKAYVVNGFEAEGFTAAGLRGGRQKGSKADADDLAGVARLDYTALPGLLVGGSVYRGDSGQDLEIDVGTTIFEVHADWKWRGLSLRALGAVAEVEDASELTALLAEEGATPDPVGERMAGWYLEAGYDVLSVLRPGEASLSPFVRYEAYNTQDEVPSGFAASGKNDVTVTTVGVNFEPLAHVVLKGDYQFYDNEAGTASDQWNLAMGYVF